MRANDDKPVALLLRRLGVSLVKRGGSDDTVLRHGELDDSAQFIGKPYTVAELTRRVRELLDVSGV